MTGFRDGTVFQAQMIFKKRLNRIFHSLTKCVVKHLIHHLEKPENCRKICHEFVDPTIDFALRQTISKIHQIDIESPFLHKIIHRSESFLIRRLGPSLFFVAIGFLLMFCMLLSINLHVYHLTKAMHHTSQRII